MLLIFDTLVSGCTVGKRKMKSGHKLKWNILVKLKTKMYFWHVILLLLLYHKIIDAYMVKNGKKQLEKVIFEFNLLRF